jgi:hypothetical protein
VLGDADTPERVGRALLTAVGRVEQVLDDLPERIEALEQPERQKAHWTGHIGAHRPASHAPRYGHAIEVRSEPPRLILALELALRPGPLAFQESFDESADDDGHREPVVRAPGPEFLQLALRQSNREHGWRSAG